MGMPDAELWLLLSRFKMELGKLKNKKFTLDESFMKSEWILNQDFPLKKVVTFDIAWILPASSSFVIFSIWAPIPVKSHLYQLQPYSQLSHLFGLHRIQGNLMAAI